MEKRYFTSLSLISLIDFLDWDDFNISGDVISAAKVKHPMRFGNTSDVIAREAASLGYKAKGSYGMRLGRCAN